MLDQFDRLRRRNAFLEQYKKEKLFENGLEEFDDARLVNVVFSPFNPS
jgi:tubulin gamma